MSGKGLSTKEKIAKRIAMEFKDGDLVNLGAGIPLLCANFIEEGKDVYLHAENGIVGAMSLEEGDDKEEFLSNYMIDAGENPVRLLPEGSIIDSATSFGIIRGGHLAATVLGAMQVDQFGNLANWMVPGGKFAGMGGAMDLVTGAKKVIIATEHCSKDGKPKILKQCTFPFTGAKVVNLIVTEYAVFEVTEKGLLLKEISEDIRLERLKEMTDADFEVSKDLKMIKV